MADTNLLNAPDDPKAAKAKLKADKKEYRKSLKEQRKAQKDKEREFADRSAEINGDNAGGLATLVITFLIILIWLAIMALLVKLDVGGFGSDILAPILKDIPYINMILPEGSYEKKTTSNTTEVVVDEGTGTANTGSIDNLEDAMSYISKLEKLLQDEMAQNATLTAENEKLRAEVARLEPFEQQQKEFYELKEQFYEEIIYSDKTPDPEKFVQWYEQMNPESAAEIYAKIKKEGEDEDSIKAYATTYSGMKAKSAAAIFDEMVEENQIELVSKILAQMSIENRADILAAMKEAHAAKLTQLLEPVPMEDKSPKIPGN